MANTLKYNAEFHDDWAWSLAIRGATYQEIATEFHVSKRTIIRWVKEHPSFGEAIERGTSGANAKVEKSLYQRALGYTAEDEERLVEMDKDGNMKPVKIRKTKRHIPGDVGAMCFWLKNRAPDEWADRPHGTIEVEDISETDEEIYGNSGSEKEAD